LQQLFFYYCLPVAERQNKNIFVPLIKFMSAKTEILFEPFPKQVEFLEAIFSGEYDFVLYGGSIRGGKTFSGIGALLILCKAFPGSRWAIVRTDLQTLRRNTIPSFWKVVPRAFVKSYNQQKES
jgi:hypothetical protein